MGLQNIKISLRHLLKHKFISFINIFGLSVGITCCIIIFLYVQYELSFDKHLKHKENLYRIVTHSPGTDEIDKGGETPFPLGEAIRLNINSHEQVLRIKHATGRIIHYNDHKYEIGNIVFAETNFFELFDVEWIYGDVQSSFSDPNSIILTESISKKLFNNANGINTVLDLERLYNLKVTGIIKDSKKTTSLPYDVIIPVERLTTEFVGINYDLWTIILGGFQTYVLLPENISKTEYELQLNDYYKALEFDRKDESEYYLQAITDVHFKTEYSNLNYTIDRKILLILSIIGLLILVVACINYINLSIPQAIKRSKEVGIRKVIGADKNKLFTQFFVESFVIVFIAITISVLLVEILLPKVNLLIGNSYDLKLYSNAILIGFLITMFISIWFLTGIYPSVIISRFKPIEAIKNKITSHSKKVTYLRNGLLVFQMLVAQILIVCAIVISKQVDYFFKKDLGFETESIICFSLPEVEKYDVFKNNLLVNPNIINISAGIAPPLANNDHRFESTFRLLDTDQEREIICDVKTVDENYIKTFGLEIIAGETMPEDGWKDSSRCVIINETAAKRIGFDNPADALGTRLNLGRITGIVKDFHLTSLHDRIPMMAMFYYPRFFGYGFAKIHPQNKNAAIAAIEKEWKKQFPDHIFDNEAYTTYLKRIYKEELQIFDLIKLFSLLAIIIACLGLFGIISFLLLQKEKEISIRKVFGASLSKLFSLLTKNYIILIIIANIIAIPIAYYFLNNWLINYSYRIEIGVTPFILAFLITVVIMMLTVSYQTLKTALANPVKALKYE